MKRQQKFCEQIKLNKNRLRKDEGSTKKNYNDIHVVRINDFRNHHFILCAYFLFSRINQNILEEINKLKYTELQRKIVKDAVYYEFADGTMGIRGAWIAPDPREIHLE